MLCETLKLFPMSRIGIPLVPDCLERRASGTIFGQ